jgi:aryl-alcohol dehydrogenase-like predicted oxidoreductase
MKNVKRTVLSTRLPPVSRIAIGSLTVSGMQAALPKDEASRVLAYAFDCGINFIDTAQYYANYDLIRGALDICKNPDDVVVSTKTYAYSKETAEAAVEEARQALNRDVIDIFMLHEQESYDTLRGHREAYEYLLECRERGIIRAVGASTHHVALVHGLLRLLDEGVPVDVCHPLYNKAGIGIADGTTEEMGAVLEVAHSRGIGIFGMKALGGGHLCTSAEDALRFVLEKPFIDAVAIGMQSVEEIDANIRFLEDGKFSAEDAAKLAEKHRTLHIEEYCEGCGACVKRCGAGALSLIEVHDEDEQSPTDLTADFAREAGITIEASHSKYRAIANDEKCVRCGYCAKVCPVFALKIY